MKLVVEWQNPVQLTHHKELKIDEKALPEEIENRAGVYFFSRKFGDKYTPFYIGETLKLRTRLGQHLKTFALKAVLLGLQHSSTDDVKIQGGERYFHFGYFKAGKGQQTKICILILQRHLVSEALEKKARLLNKQLITDKTHTIEFFGTPAALAIYDKSATIEA